MSVRIAPSILAADLSRLADDIARAEAGGCDLFHLDIMDGHFVPNLSFGPAMVGTVRRLTDKPLDVHLMLDNPRAFIAPFADAGADWLTVHVEVLDRNGLLGAFENIRDRGVRPGISLNPDTPVDSVAPYLDRVDLLLVMSVFPGFGGQHFIEASYDRIRAAAAHAARVNPGLVISVDGGVGVENAAGLTTAGATQLVAGTSVFADHGARENVPRLRAAAGG